MKEDHFNKLSAHQHELLTKIFEEASEINQAIAKIMLHGLDSSEPLFGSLTNDCSLSNKEKLENELGDLSFFVDLACQKGLLNPNSIKRAQERRRKRVNHYFHHVEIEQ